MKIQANQVMTHDLWHRRMGHPSNNALSNLSSIISGIKHSSCQRSLCDVCLRAKQTLLSFATSENKSLESL